MTRVMFRFLRAAYVGDMEDRNMKTILRSSELTCPSCVLRIEKSLKSVQGVSAAKVHFATGRIDVEHDEAQAPVDRLVDAVRAVGYDAEKAAL